MNDRRHPKGTPTGGQFAPGANAEAPDIELTEPAVIGDLRADWRYAVQNGDTQRGFDEWLQDEAPSMYERSEVSDDVAARLWPDEPAISSSEREQMVDTVADADSMPRTWAESMEDHQLEARLDWHIEVIFRGETNEFLAAPIADRIAFVSGGGDLAKAVQALNGLRELHRRFGLDAEDAETSGADWFDATAQLLDRLGMEVS